jgi:ABC-type multidrug transport system permease subunit
MKNFIREHESMIEEALKRNDELQVLRAHHEQQIRYLQAERFAHLFVMLAVAFFTVGSFVALTVQPSLLTAALLGMFLILIVPYLLHYFRLENAVQRWYRLARQMDRTLGRLPRWTQPGLWG